MPFGIGGPGYPDEKSLPNPRICAANQTKLTGVARWHHFAATGLLARVTAPME
jgi:hypothetical protein